MLGDKLHRSIRRKNQLVNALTAALAERDYTTKLHAERLQDLCPKLGRRLGLSEREQADLALLARVHDVGKVGIPDSILFKRGTLSGEERTIMQQHPEKGYRIASSSRTWLTLPDLSCVIMNAGMARVIPWVLRATTSPWSVASWPW